MLELLKAPVYLVYESALVDRHPDPATGDAQVGFHRASDHSFAGGRCEVLPTACFTAAKCTGGTSCRRTTR